MRDDTPAIPETTAVDLLSEAGHIVAVTPAQLSLLGYDGAALMGADWSRIYPLASRDVIAGLFQPGGVMPVVVALEMRRADGSTLPVTAVAERISGDQGGPCLKLTKWPRGGRLDEIASLSEENEVLHGILDASDDAGWCMEWTDPVDLSAPEHEIIRQIFENGPRWRFCNAAMARLYRTPKGSMFNDRPVHETFPRTPANEAFLGRLIAANFDINGCPSRDRRYDGAIIEVENDVRGHVRGNRLYRMWGTVRDVSKHMRRLALVQDELENLETILSALPDAVIVTDRLGAIRYLNRTAEDIVGVPASNIGSYHLADIVTAGFDSEVFFADTSCRTIEARIRNPSGSRPVQITARKARLSGEDWLVLTLRVDTAAPIAAVPEAVPRDQDGPARGAAE